jgi:hypothetical protein
VNYSNQMKHGRNTGYGSNLAPAPFLIPSPRSEARGEGVSSPFEFRKFNPLFGAGGKFCAHSLRDIAVWLVFSQTPSAYSVCLAVQKIPVALSPKIVSPGFAFSFDSISPVVNVTPYRGRFQTDAIQSLCNAYSNISFFPPWAACCC